MYSSTNPSNNNPGERQPMMNTPRGGGNRGDHPNGYGGGGNTVPLSRLRNEDGGYLGPAAYDGNSVYPDLPGSIGGNPPPIPSHNNTRQPYNGASNMPKNNVNSISGSIDLDSSSQIEKNRNGPCTDLSWQNRTTCEQILLLATGLLVIFVVTLGVGLGVVTGLAPTNADYGTCQSKECVRAAGEILNSIDETIDPCEDFVEFTCGNWYDHHPAPEGSFRYSMLDTMDENMLYQIKQLLEEEQEEDEPTHIKAAKVTYQACVNTTGWQEMGLVPMLVLLQIAGGMPVLDPQWNSTDFSLELLLAWLRSNGGENIIALGVMSDVKNSSQNIIYIDQGILPLPPQKLSNMTEEEEQYYLMYMNKVISPMLEYLYGEDALLFADAVKNDTQDMLKLAVDLAKISVPKGAAATDSDPWDMYNHMTVKELDKITNNNDIPYKFNWTLYFERTFGPINITISEDDIISVQEISYLEKLTQVLNQTSTRTLANYLLYQLVDAMAEETSALRGLRNQKLKEDKFVRAFGRTYSRPWFDCAMKIRMLMGMVVGEMYFRKNSLTNATHIADRLVADITESFRDMLTSATWMSNKTAEQAHKKLDNMVQLVAFPEYPLTEEFLEDYLYGFPNVSTEDHFGNMMMLSKWRSQRDLRRLIKPPDRKRWPSTPVEINAFYASLLNSIVIPGGVLQPPLFYHDHRLGPLNFGGIGAIIGHEITHGFDNTGRNFNYEGDLTHWWDDKTLELYLNKTKCFEDQYSQYNVTEILAPFESMEGNPKIDGVMSEGENIADNGGVRAAFAAYRNHIADTGENLILPGLQHYNQDQLFFISYSRIWCVQFTPMALQYLLASDSHPPGHYRVLGTLQNNEEFSKAFSCPVGSRMNPEKKCLLW